MHTYHINTNITYEKFSKFHFLLILLSIYFLLFIYLLHTSEGLQYSVSPIILVVSTVNYENARLDHGIVGIEGQDGVVNNIMIMMNLNPIQTYNYCKILNV